MSQRVLVVTSDHVGRLMAGPAIRAVNLARELAGRGFVVTLAAPNAADATIDGVARVRLGARDAGGTIALAREHDAVVTQRLPAKAMVTLARSDTRVIYDLYDPVPHELLAAAHGREPQPHDDLDLLRNQLVAETALRAGDAFICASERQRDLWLGALGTLGRLDHEEHARDPTLRSLIDVVPFGIESAPPVASAPVLRGVVPHFDEDSKILIWGGGIWNWLDPITVIRAVHEFAREDETVRLVFLGVRRPNYQVADNTMLEHALAVARQLGAYGTSVFFNDDWVPYERRGAWLTEADVGVSAHFDTVETRFAFRTRLLDYLWACLPIATTGGDVLGELVAEKRLGTTLAPEDVDGWIAALRRLLGDEGARRAATENVASMRERFEWRRVVEPLARLLVEPGRHVALRPAARLVGAQELYLGARSSVRKRGLTGTLRYALKNDVNPRGRPDRR